MTNAYDLVVLGGGSGGYAAALRAAQLGLKVALVERDKIGGTCLHRGCIPTKALLHAAEVADHARHGAAVGVKSTLTGVDARALRDYTDKVVEKLHAGLKSLVKARKVEVVTGTGRLVETADGHGIAVGDTVLSGRAVVLATGSAPKSLPGVEIDGARVINSEHALRLEKLPASVIVLGGGVIGIEFASAWSSLGVAVTVVEALDRILSAEDAGAAKVVQKALEGRGVKVRTGVPVARVSGGGKRAELELAGGEVLTADLVLVAVGRAPVSEGLAEAGVELDRGWVRVNERLETSRPDIFAVGDLVAGPQLAHRGFTHGLFVAEEVAGRLGRGPRPVQPTPDHLIPKVTYSDPQVASVGLTEEAAKAGGAVEVTKYDLGGNAMTQILGGSGFVKVVRRVDGPVLGIHAVGPRAGELMGEAQLITAWEAMPAEVAALLHAHPTLGEALGEAHLALAGRPLHAHS